MAPERAGCQQASKSVPRPQSRYHLIPARRLLKPDVWKDFQKQVSEGKIGASGKSFSHFRWRPRDIKLNAEDFKRVLGEAMDEHRRDGWTDKPVKRTPRPPTRKT